MNRNLLSGILVIGLFSLSVNAQLYSPGSNIRSTATGISDRIGILTDSPSEALDIAGGGNIKTGSLILGGWYGSPKISFNSTLDAPFIKSESDFHSSQLYFDIGTGKLYFRNTVTKDDQIPSWRYPFTIHPNSRVAIGNEISNQDPQAKLHVFDNAIIGPRLTSSEELAFNNGISQKLRLLVNGTLGAKEVRISLNSWADHVFEKGYRLKSLQELEYYIQNNNHLPNVPSEKEIIENGVSVNEMLKIQMEKIEELTLYMIQLKKENDILSKEIKEIRLQKTK